MVRKIVCVVSLTLIMIMCMGCSSDNRYIGNPYSDLPVYAEDNDNSTQVVRCIKRKRQKSSMKDGMIGLKLNSMEVKPIFMGLMQN